MSGVQRFQFHESANLADAEAALLLAVWSTESLHGETAVRLDAPYQFDRETRECIVDESHEVGRDLSRLMLGFLRRELNDGDFSVERMGHPAPADLVPACG